VLEAEAEAEGAGEEGAEEEGAKSASCRISGPVSALAHVLQKSLVKKQIFAIYSH
jgi:hypothetical protein